MQQVAALAEAIGQHRTDPTEIAKAVVEYINAGNVKVDKKEKSE